MIFSSIITFQDYFWSIVWGWYYSAFVFFFTIIFSIFIMKKKSISSLIMFAHCYWISFFLYGLLFVIFFLYTHYKGIYCYALSYNLVASCYIAFFLFLLQFAIVLYIRALYRINLKLVGKTVLLSSFCATFFVYYIAKIFVI